MIYMINDFFPILVLKLSGFFYYIFLKVCLFSLFNVAFYMKPKKCTIELKTSE